MIARPLAVLVSSLALVACSAGGGEPDLMLSLTADGPTELDVGDEIGIVVRVVQAAGSSTDVTDRAACELSAMSAPGRLEGSLFVAERPGVTEVRCAYEALEGALVITVRGDRPTTIREIQTGAVEVGTRVELEAVATALAPGETRLDLWVQDQGGGEASGIELRDVRTESEDGTLPALTVREGDRVRVVGTYDERNGRSVVEFESMEVEGTASVTVDPLAVGAVDEQWDGCLIELSDVVVVDSTSDDFVFAVATAADPDGPRVWVDTLLYDVRPADGDRFSLVRGPVFPFLDGSDSLQLSLVPRRASDLVDDPSGPVDPPPPPPEDPTIERVHDGTIATGTAVVIERAVVTALDFRSGGVSHFFAQDPGGGVGRGIHVRDDRSDTSELALAVGDVVQIVAEAGVRDGYPVLWFTEVVVTDEVGDAAPTRVALADLLASPDRYVGLLVELSELDVDDAEHPFGFTVTDGDAAGVLLVADALTSFPTIYADDRFATLVGAVYGGPDGLELWPRDDRDLEFVE